MNRVDWCPVVLRHLSLRLTRFNPKPLPYTRANSKKKPHFWEAHNQIVYYMSNNPPHP